MAFPADPVTMENQSPWEDDDDINWHCSIDGNFSATLNLHQAAKCENYQFEIFKGDAPMPCERFRIEARSNVVQLTLEHASRSDTGHYSLNAKRHSNENESERLFKRRVYMSVDEPSFFEEGDPPLFLRRLSDLTVKVGTRTRFLVEIRSTSETKVTWHRNDEPIKPGSRFSFVHEGNFFCVDVAPVTVEDQGHWTCMAENRSGRSSCTSHLNIIVPKAYKRPEFASELRALLTEFGSVSLECKVIGVPTPVLRWFKDNKEIKAGDVFALSANPDDPTSLGTYTCQAINCMGIAYSSSRVHVVGKGSREGSLKPADALIVAGDPPIFKRSLKDDCCRIGDSLYLACQVQVPPWPKEIAWYNKEGHVKSGDRYKIMEDGLGGYSIQIQPVEAADEGEWKCVATSYENIKQFTTCYVAMSIPRNYRKPRFMESLTAVLTEEGLVSFECKVVGFPTPLLRWFKDGKELKPGDVYQLTGTNSLGTYCCVAKNCMGEATSTAELTLEDIKNQLNDEERLQLLTINQPPKFIKGLKSCEAKICSDFKFTVQVSVMPVPNFSWYRDDHLIENEDRYQVEKENTGVVHLNILKLEFCDQAEWKCVASNDFGHSVTSCFLKLIIPRHYRKPKFLENLRAILSEGGAVNLECKVIGVPQPTLKWYKDGEELKPGDIHKIISGQDGTCSLGTYTCEATNCMGTVSSSASLLGYEDRISPGQSDSAISAKVENELELARNLSLSTINEERTSQLLETALTDQSITERGEISFTFDGKDVSVSLYETPDLTEEEAYQIIEMYADQLSEHVSEHNVVELPPMRFVKETSTSGNLYMQAVVIDVSPDYFASIEENYDQRTEADLEEISTIDITTFSSPMSGSFDDEGTPVRPPRRNSEAITSKAQEHTESYHSAPERDISLNLPDNILNTEADINAETFMDALSRAQPCDSETRKKDHFRKRSNSGDSYGTATDLLLDQTSSPVKKKKEEMACHTETEKQFGQKCEFEEPNLTFVDQIPEDIIHQRSCSSMHSEKEKIFLKNDEKQFIELLRKIAEPVLVVRRALIDSDFIFENEQLINSFVTENVLIPIQNLYDTVTDVESKALNNVEDRSFIRDISISILEIIGGPAEELLRAFELIHQENSDGSIRINLSILESLVDPVDEILFGLAKLEFDLCDQSISVNPIVLDRIIRTTNRYRDTLQKSDGNINETMMAALQKIHSALSTYLNKISVNQFGIWNENIDAVLVESLARPLEDLQRASECILLNNSIDNMEKMLEVFNEILSRLEALVVALEGYEGDYRASFVVDLKKSIVIAAEVLSEIKNEKIIYLSSLPELILDNLVDTQACVNAVIIDLEKSHAQSSSKLISDLVELREHLAFAVHKTTTLKVEEMIAALGNLEKPLINLRSSLTNISEPTEFTSLQNVIQPLITLQSTFSTLLQNIETQEEDDEISSKLQPVNVIIEDLKKNVLLISDENTDTKYENESKFDEQREIESSVPEVLYEMQFASQLGTVHYEIASILEKYEQLEGADTSLVLHNLNELRASIGNTAIAIDSIISSFKLNIDGLIRELLELEMPLNNVNDILINEKYLSVQTDVLVELQQPIERLKIIIQNFVKQIDQESVASPVVEAIVNIQKTLSLFMNSNFPISNDNYDTTDFPNVTKIRDPVSQEDNNKEFIESHGIKSHENENDEFLEKRIIYPEDIFVAKISQSLNEIEQNIVHILDKFDQELVLVSSPIASRLAEALDGLRKTILVVRSNLCKIALEFTDVKSDSSQSDSQQNTECISSALEELLCPILEVREALTQTEKFKAPEMFILKQLDQPIKAIESNVLLLALEAQSRVIDSGKSSSRASLDTIARVLKDIESQIPIALDAVNHREKMLSTLYDNLKSLEIIKDRISEILSDSSNGDNIEFDVADILIKPVDSLKLILRDFFDQIDAGGALSSKDKNVIPSLNSLIEPFIELQSALSVVRNSRRTSMVEPALQDEKKNVILKAVKELRLGIENIHFNIKKEENDSVTNVTPILVSVDDLDSALQLVQNRISETKYIRRRSCLRSLQERVSMPLKQLEQKIKLLEKELDHQILNLISESLETLLKQIQSVQEQFIDSSTQVIDEEAIIEGFLYPTQRLLTSLENLEQNEVLSRVKNHKIFLNHLAHCIAHFSNTLLTLKNELVQEGVSENISVIETLNAVLIPTNKIEKVLYEITKPIEDEEQDHKNSIDSFQKVEMRSGEQVSTVLTTVETIVDEFIEVSKHETESLTMMKVATEDNIDNEYNSGLLPLELGSDYCEFEMHLEDIETLLPNLKANESSAVSTVQSDSGISEGVDNTSMHVIGSTPSFVEEEQSSITALWSLIKEPLNKLQECISTIANVPFILESVNNRDEEAMYEKNIISSRLENLKESILVMEKIALEGTEQINLSSWPENSLPALQNLAWSLEELGEHLPIIISKSQITLEDSTENEMYQSMTAMSALKTLIAPLHDLKQRLGLIVDEKDQEQSQIIIESEVNDMERENIKIKHEKCEKSICNVEKPIIEELSETNDLNQSHNKKQKLENDEIYEQRKGEVENQKKATKKDEEEDKKYNEPLENDEKQTIFTQPTERLKNQEDDSVTEKTTNKLKESGTEKEKKEETKQVKKEEKRSSELKKDENLKNNENKMYEVEAAKGLEQDKETNEKLGGSKKLCLVTEEKKIEQEHDGYVVKEEIEKREQPQTEHPKEEKHELELEKAELPLEVTNKPNEIKQTESLQETDLFYQEKTGDQNYVKEDKNEKETNDSESLKQEDVKHKQVQAGPLEKEQKEQEEAQAEKLKTEEDKIKQAQAEMSKQEKTEKATKAEVERLKQEEEEQQKQSEDERQEREEEEKKIQTETERLKREEEGKQKQAKDERLKKEEEKKQKKTQAGNRTKEEEQEREKQAENERLKREEEEKKKQAEAEKLIKEEEKERDTQADAERLKRNEEEKQKHAEAERVEKKEKEKQKQADAEKLRKEEEEMQKQAEAERLKKEEEEKQKLAEVERVEKEEEEKHKQAKIERQKKEEKEKQKQAEAEKLRKEEEERQKQAEAECLKKEEEEKQKQAEAERLRKEEEEREKQADAEKLRKEEEEMQKQAEAERLRKEEEEREKQAEAERLKRKEEEKQKQAEAERLKNEEENKQKQAEAERLKKEEEEKLKQAEAERLRKEEEEREKQAEDERLKREEEEKQKQAEAERLKKEEEEKQKQAEAERLKKEEEEKQKQAEAERLKKKEEEERQKQAEAERLKKEEEEKQKQAEAERLKKEEEEREKQAEADKLRKEEEEREKQAEAERLKKKEEEKQKQAEAERLKKEEEEKQKQAEAERLKREEEEKQKQAEAEKLRKEEEEKQKQAEAERLRKEGEESEKQAEDERLKREEEEKQKQAEAERLKKEEEEKLKEAEAERLKKKEEEERQKQAEAERLKREEEEKQKQAEAERLKKEEEEKLKEAEAERLKKKEEEERQKQAEAERLKKEEEEKLKEAEAERLKREEEEKQKQAEAEKLRKEEEEKQKQAEAERLRKEEEESEKQAEDERLRKEEEEKQKQAEAERLKKEEEEKLKEAEAESLKKKEEEERQKQAEAERLKKEEEEKQKQAEAERLKREEEEKQKQAEAEKLRKEEEERQKQTEAERLKKEEEEKLKEVEAERLRKEEEEKEKQAEAERLKKEEEEKQKQAEAERLKKEEEEKLKEAEAERLRKEEEEREKQAEAERLKKEEEEKQKQAEAERLKREEEEKQKQAEAEKLRKEEEEKQKQAEADRLRKEEEEKLKEAEAERLKKKEEERQKQAEAERLKKEEEEKQKQAEAERLKREEEEKQKQAEAEKLRKEEEEKQKQAEAERLRKEEEEKLKEAEAERLKKKEEERQKQAEAERLKKEEEEKQKQAEAERLKREEEEKQKQAEAEQLRKEEEESEKQAEDERLKREEEEKQKQAEAERLKKEEEEKLKEAEAERLKKEEEEKQKQAEAERLKQEEENKQKQAEVERLKREEEEKQKQAEAERLKKEEEEKLKQAEAERLRKEEEEREKQAEADKLRKEEEEREKQAEADKLRKEEEEERQKQVEAERLKKEEEEKQKQSEAERLKREEEEKQKQVEAARLKEHEEKQKLVEAERLKKEEEEKQKQAEADKLRKEEEERQKQAEAERLKKEEEEKQKQSEAERLKQEEENKQKQAEAERLKREEEEKQKQVEAARLKEHEEKQKLVEAERLKKEEDEKQKQAEIERQKEEEKKQKQAESERLRKKEEEEREKQAEAERSKREEEEKQKQTEVVGSQKEEVVKHQHKEADREVADRHQQADVQFPKEEKDDKRMHCDAELVKRGEVKTDTIAETGCFNRDNEGGKREEVLKNKSIEALVSKSETIQLSESVIVNLIDKKASQSELINSKKNEISENSIIFLLEPLNSMRRTIFDMLCSFDTMKCIDNESKSSVKNSLFKDCLSDLHYAISEIVDSDISSNDEEVNLTKLHNLIKAIENFSSFFPSQVVYANEAPNDSKNDGNSDQKVFLNISSALMKPLQDLRDHLEFILIDDNALISDSEKSDIDISKSLSSSQQKNEFKNEIDDLKLGQIEKVDELKEKRVEKCSNQIKNKSEVMDVNDNSKESSNKSKIRKKSLDKKNDSINHSKRLLNNQKTKTSDSSVQLPIDDTQISEMLNKKKDVAIINPVLDSNTEIVKQNSLPQDKISSNNLILESKNVSSIKRFVRESITPSTCYEFTADTKSKNRFISKSRDDLLNLRYNDAPFLSPLSVSSIPDLYLTGESYDTKLKSCRVSSSTYSLDQRSNSNLKSMSSKIFGSAMNFDRPSYTPKLIARNEHSLSVADSLALSRSRRRFESRNAAIIYDEKSKWESVFNDKLSDRGRCPSFCTQLTNSTVAEGSRLRLICTTIGMPEPEVYWTKNGDRIRPGGKEKIKYENGIATLEILPAELEDAGYYTCIAKNLKGQAFTEATVRIYSVYHTLSTETTSNHFLKEKLNRSNVNTSLEYGSRFRSTPHLPYLHDGETFRSDKYSQTSNQMHRLDSFTAISNQYRSRSTAHKIYDKSYNVDTKLPQVSSVLTDHKVPAGGTIALQVEIKDRFIPNVTWLRSNGDRKEIISSPKAKTFVESNIYTLVVPEATESEAGTYVCRVSNAFGHIDTSATIEVISSNKIDDFGKPAMFVSRPLEKLMQVIEGESVSISFRMSGTPKPRVTWMKGLKDITDGPRSHKDMIDDYVRLSLSRVTLEDEGTYCILVKNCYGCDRFFFTLKLKLRARSLTPTAEKLSLSEHLSDIHCKELQSYLRNVPGPISSGPIVVDGGRNWLSLTWGKTVQRGPAPVIAYRVDAWQMGEEGGARWIELGVTPINSFDAFNLRPGGEYKFRITPKNRYGWGESVTMSGSATVCDNIAIPEFTKILPDQLKALIGSTVQLECEVRSDSKYIVKWFRETIEIDSSLDYRYTVHNESNRCSLTLSNIKEADSGRYICEVSNKAGRVSSYGRVLVVSDPKILNADVFLKKRFQDGFTECGPPQFTMRLRDRRVQTSYPVRLTCQVYGSPEPEVIWLKDGQRISPTPIHSIYKDESHFHTLEIARSSPNDSGTYSACAKNSSGSVSCHCELVVDKGIRAYIAPKFSYGLNADYEVKIGSELRLTAQIEAYPSVGIVWHRDGVRLRPRRTSIMTLTHDGTIELLLTKVTSRDAGVYTCTATNEVGKVETSTRVSILDPDDNASSNMNNVQPHVIINPPENDIPYSKKPEFLTKPLSSESEEGQTVVIQCEVVGDPKPEVMWLRDFLKPEYYRDAPHFRCIGVGPQYLLEIPHAKLEYTGTYSVLAKNKHGEAKAVISLQIYAKGQGKCTTMDQNRIKTGDVISVPKIKRPLTDIRCCDGDAVTLDCSIHVLKELPSIRWEKFGKAITLDKDFSTHFDGESAKLIIKYVYPEDEGEYTCIFSNELGNAMTSACLIVDVPEGKENTLSRTLVTKPQGLRLVNSTPMSTARSTPVRSLSPTSKCRNLKPLVLPRAVDRMNLTKRKPKICPPKFYSIPHNRVVEEGETVRFQCAVSGHPLPWCTWDKDGQPLTNSSRVSITEKDDIRTVEISDVHFEDAGLYRVTLENDVGKTEATARLEIISK
ncbi:hypothetical protein TKK_0007901 [Trichogramma kaykai]|uniref:Uncharacterized protein n=1 Tax=Trichogramma kaykai TaxID=54128 RepID=A0ABD2X7T1_9HYME